MKKWIIIWFVLHLSLNAVSQTSEDSVKAVVNRLFDAMRHADALMLKSCFADSTILQTVIKKTGQLLEVRTENVSEFADFISKEAEGNADERIKFDIIKIDGLLATVWTEYKFYYKNIFSHCGVNSFQLVRFNDGWKIQYLIDTRRKSPCL